MDVLKCPNCGAQVSPDAQGVLHCGQCGGSFQWHAGEAKLTGVGLKDKVEGLTKEVAELKERLGQAADPSDNGKVKETPAEPKADDQDDDDDGDF